MSTGTSQTEAQSSDKLTSRGFGNRLILVSAVLFSVVGLITLNATVLHYFLGNLTRTGTQHLLNKTELYDLELAINETIDDRAKATERLVNQHGSSLNREIQEKFATFDQLLDNLRSEFDSVIADLKTVTSGKNVDVLKEKIPKLQEGVEKIDVNKPNVTFLFEFDIRKLLEETKIDREITKKGRSEFFFCREPYNSEKTHWEVDTEFQITLLNQAGKDHLMTKRRQHTFSDEDDEDIGFRTLKLFKDLEGEGFIKDNKIQLKVELIAEKLVRNDLLT